MENGTHNWVLLMTFWLGGKKKINFIEKKSLNDIAFKYYSCFGIFLERFLEQNKVISFKKQIVG